MAAETQSPQEVQRIAQQQAGKILSHTARYVEGSTAIVPTILFRALALKVGAPLLVFATILLAPTPNGLSPEDRQQTSV